jgi:hypothetical protein
MGVLLYGVGLPVDWGEWERNPLYRQRKHRWWHWRTNACQWRRLSRAVDSDYYRVEYATDEERARMVLREKFDVS